MRKLTTIAVCAALVCMSMFTLAACGQQNNASSAGNTAASATSEQGATTYFATLADVYAEDPDGMESTFDEQRYACTFNWGGVWWRVEAPLTDGLYDKLNEVWVEDQDKVKELLSPLAVSKEDKLTDAIDLDTLASYAGKTGADLAAAGFQFSAGTLVVNGNETDCVASNGNFDYLVTLDGKVADENAEDTAGAVADLKVTNVALQGVSWSVLEG